MSLAIYDAIRDVYSGQQLPSGDAGVFFGYSGCTRSTLEYALNLLRGNLGSWFDVSAATKDAFFRSVANTTANATGCDRDGIVKYCNWCLVAAKKDPYIKNWFSGGDYSTIDYWVNKITCTVTSTASEVAETVEYGLTKETQAEKTIFGTIFPVLGVLGACYLVKKILD